MEGWKRFSFCILPHLFLRKETVVTARESGDRPLAFAPANVYLAVPENFCGIRLEIFDRGAVPCSLFRPLGALTGYAPPYGQTSGSLCQLGDVTYRGKICVGRREPLSGRAPPAVFRWHRAKLI